MKSEYQSYTRNVNGLTFYFVKHFIVVPEVDNINPVLMGYGMHQQFEKACTIAGLTDAQIRKEIYPGIVETKEGAKIIRLNTHLDNHKKISG